MSGLLHDTEVREMLRQHSLDWGSCDSPETCLCSHAQALRMLVALGRAGIDRWSGAAYQVCADIKGPSSSQPPDVASGPASPQVKP